MWILATVELSYIFVNLPIRKIIVVRQIGKNLWQIVFPLTFFDSSGEVTSTAVRTKPIAETIQKWIGETLKMSLYASLFTQPHVIYFFFYSSVHFLLFQLILFSSFNSILF